MKLITTALIGMAILGILFVVICFSNRDVADFVKYHSFYSEYMEWKINGGPFDPSYKEPLLLDRKRNELIKGLSTVEIVRKLPFLVSGATFPVNSYKGSYFKSINSGKTAVYWFTNLDSFDWCVVIEDGIGVKLELVKG